MGGSVYSESFKKRSWESATPPPESNSQLGSGPPATAKYGRAYIGMGSLAWRVTYQHGRIPAWGKRERTQGRSSSGLCESIS